jgi:hypothetical protein
MARESPATSRSVIAKRFGRRVNQTTLLLLLFAVPALSTLAKTSWYLPQTDTRHCLNNAVKMEVVHSHFVFNGALLQPIAKVAPLLPEARRASRQAQPELSAPSIALIVSFQRRPPPVSSPSRTASFLEKLT